jgi:trimethylamine:corrinoid methyltransferase-like protein
MKTANSIAFQSPQFSLLSESQLKDIHLAALEVVRRTGIRFHHKEAVDVLKKAGAFVSDGNLVRLPARMVEDARPTSPTATACATLFPTSTLICLSASPPTWIRRWPTTSRWP